MPMTGEPDPRPINGGSRPVPDPTVLTTQLVDRALEAERLRTESQLDVLRERLKGIDKATELLAKNVEFIHSDVITDIGTAVSAATEVLNEKFVSVEYRFSSVGEQFSGRDTAVAAALQAQKEAVGKQDEANQKAIDKSERTTLSLIDVLDRKIEDLKTAQTRLDQTVFGMAQSATGGLDAITASRDSQSNIRATILAAAVLLSTLIAVVGFALSNKP